MLRIPSDTVPGREYSVDPIRGSCNCPAGIFGRRCKHVRRAREMTQVEHASIEEAFVAAQAEVEVALKDTTGQIGQNRGYKYADLASVWDACRPALRNHGLGVMQLPGTFVNGCQSLTTKLIWKGGGCIEETMSIPVPKADPQGCGSAITYMRRYSLAAMLGILQDDDDGRGSIPQGPTAREENTTRQLRQYDDDSALRASAPPSANALHLSLDEQQVIRDATNNNPVIVGRIIKHPGGVNKDNWQEVVHAHMQATGLNVNQIADALMAGRK